MEGPRNQTALYHCTVWHAQIVLSDTDGELISPTLLLKICNRSHFQLLHSSSTIVLLQAISATYKTYKLYNDGA